MQNVERRVGREARAMTRREVITKAITKQLSWVQASEILGISVRHMRRVRRKVEGWGMSAVMDQHGGRPRRKRIKAGTIELLCRLKRDVYADFSVRHFYLKITEKHGVKVSYNWLRLMLQEAGVVQQEPARGRYRRRRERRPMVDMLVHLDASAHDWIAGLPMQDLVVALDDADGRILYARFFAQEGTASTFAALESVVRNYGRFCELYTDRGSHLCHSARPSAVVDEQNGQVSQALHALGIHQILARSPQARGRSERAFGTIRDGCPRNSGITASPITPPPIAIWSSTSSPTSIAASRSSLRSPKARSSNWRASSCNWCSRVNMSGARVTTIPSLSKTWFSSCRRPATAHTFVRCPVTVHQFADGKLGISYQSRLLARYDAAGQPLHP